MKSSPAANPHTSIPVSPIKAPRDGAGWSDAPVWSRAIFGALPRTSAGGTGKIHLKLPVWRVD
jgi:hypothetical protein